MRYPPISGGSGFFDIADKLDIADKVQESDDKGGWVARGACSTSFSLTIPS
jgi:hypothetical protein